MTTQIAVIDGLFCPFELKPDFGPRGGKRERVVYWGVGYHSAVEAARAIDAVARGGTNPEGVSVDFDSGERVRNLDGSERPVLHRIA